MNFLFLDIDGVLCTWESMKGKRTSMLIPPVKGLNRNQRRRNFAALCQRSIANLNVITSRAKASIVLSSTWRKGRVEAFMLTVQYLKWCKVEAEIVGRTPAIYHPIESSTNPKTCVSADRGEEIQAWLDEAKRTGTDVDKIVIMDDDSDMLHLTDRLVKTSLATGIQDRHVEQALELFGVPPLL